MAGWGILDNCVFEKVESTDLLYERKDRREEKRNGDRRI